MKETETGPVNVEGND